MNRPHCRIAALPHCHPALLQYSERLYGTVFDPHGAFWLRENGEAAPRLPLPVCSPPPQPASFCNAPVLSCQRARSLVGVTAGVHQCAASMPACPGATCRLLLWRPEIWRQCSGHHQEQVGGGGVGSSRAAAAAAPAGGAADTHRADCPQPAAHATLLCSPGQHDAVVSGFPACRWVHHTSFLWDYREERMTLLKQPHKQPEYRQVCAISLPACLIVCHCAWLCSRPAVLCACSRRLPPDTAAAAAGPYGCFLQRVSHGNNEWMNVCNEWMNEWVDVKQAQCRQDYQGARLVIS